MILNLIGQDQIETEGRFAGILGRTDEYIGIQFPGRSVYKGSIEGTQYEPAWVCIGKITAYSEYAGIMEVEPVLQFKLRR